ncbi:MAG: tRNA lysidine(34) synthetase TilS [Planctomycetota bacterium]|nr:tRNA lysidine(34) synthetase TilS [Planctomycetota bacterium]
MNRTLPRVCQAILETWPADRWSGKSVVVALSGGPDSVAMLRALDEIVKSQAVSGQTRLVVAHLNHRLRGAQSDLDEAFVRELAQLLGLEAVIEVAPEPMHHGGESRWRKARAEFLRRTAQRVDAQWIATAATADDQVETMLHHLLRGTGPAGLAGIRSERSLGGDLRLAHPLIGVWKPELLEYLSSLGQAYRVDQSNLSNDFTRNRIRNECLPYLEQFVGSDRLKQRLWTAGELIRQEHEVIEAMAKQWLDSAAIDWQQDRLQIIDWKGLAALPWPVLQSVLVRIWHRMHWPLQEVGNRHWNRVRLWLEKSRKTTHPQRLQMPGRIELYLRQGKLRIGRLDATLKNSEESV